MDRQIIKKAVPVFISIVGLVTVLFSCTQDFVIDTGETDNRLVLEGAITDEAGPYFFRLGKISMSGGDFSQTGIVDALMVISDSNGVVDTLQVVRPEMIRKDKRGNEVLVINTYSGIPDTMFYSGGTEFLRGFYYTTKISGIPGNTYFLKIKYNGRIITATDRMPSAPVLDSVQFFKKTLSIEGKGDFFIPRLYFRNPLNEKNYYMMNFGKDNLLYLTSHLNRVWEFSVIDDVSLPEYVNGLNMDDGAAPDGYADSFYNYNWYYNAEFGWETRATIRLLSLSEGAYRYYKSLISQFENDGGAYTPTPVTPSSNLSGNSLGYFRASAVSEKRVAVLDYGVNNIVVKQLK